MERRPKRRPRPELEVENEPELILMTRVDWWASLSLPASWTPERRQAVAAHWYSL